MALNSLNTILRQIRKKTSRIFKSCYYNEPAVLQIRIWLISRSISYWDRKEILPDFLFRPIWHSYSIRVAKLPKVNWALEGTADIMVTPKLGVASILCCNGSTAILWLYSTRSEYSSFCVIKFQHKMDDTSSFGVIMISEMPSNPQLTLTYFGQNGK